MRAAAGIVVALSACAPGAPQVAEGGILPAFVAIPVAASSQLKPDCTYWSPTDQAMRHPPDGAACVSFATDQAQSVADAYSAEFARAGWRVVDQFANKRLYEKTVSPGCTQRVDFAVYSTQAPSNLEPAATAVIVFAPHDGPICAGHS